VRQGGPCRPGAEVAERGGIDARAQSHDSAGLSPLSEGRPRKKGRILDDIVESTLYARAYAALVLRQWGTSHWQVGPRGPLKLVAAVPAFSPAYPQLLLAAVCYCRSDAVSQIGTVAAGRFELPLRKARVADKPPAVEAAALKPNDDEYWQVYNLLYDTPGYYVGDVGLPEKEVI